MGAAWARPLRGRRVLVTGATGGIGSALCAELAAAGARLAITGRSPTRLAELATALSQRTDVVASAGDIADEASVAAVFTDAIHALGGIDALVNLAGGSEPGPIAETELAAFHGIVDANLTGTFLACKHFLRAVDPADHPVIVNVASMAGKRANPTSPLYCTAKAAVGMLSQSLALQCKEQNVRVSTLNPGGTDTGFWGDRPVDRATLMSADDVAEVILFTLSCPAHVALHEVSFESSGLRREQ